MAEGEVSADTGFADVSGIDGRILGLGKTTDFRLDGSGLTHSLSHLLSVVKHLEPAWTRAFLKRARFLDPDFQGDVLAVICLFPQLRLLD